MDHPLQIFYRDAALAVCCKPAGCLSEAGPGRTLPALLAAELAGKGEAEDVFTVHRLDREVAGLSVLARTHEAASALIDQFAAHTVDKEYYAVLRGAPARHDARTARVGGDLARRVSVGCFRWPWPRAVWPSWLSRPGRCLSAAISRPVPGRYSESCRGFTCCRSLYTGESFAYSKTLMGI